MRSNPTSTARPFDQGAASVKQQDGLPNPYPAGSIEFGNYELGRAHALRANPSLAMPPAAAIPSQIAPARRASAKARVR